MLQKRFSIILLLFVSLFVLAACTGGEEGAAEPTAAPVEEAVAEAAPTQEPAEEAEPTAAPAEETAPAGARTFAVDSAGSSASFVVDEEFLSQALSKLGIEAGNQEIVGTTEGVTGELTLNSDNADPLEAASFTVDMTGLATDQSRRDSWLKDNAIQTNAFPNATFVATGTEGLPAEFPEGSDVSFKLNGDLTVRDVTNSVSFDVTAVLNDDTITGVATLPLNMTDFNIEPPNFADTLTVADAFMIRVELTAREQ